MHIRRAMHRGHLYADSADLAGLIARMVECLPSACTLHGRLSRDLPTRGKGRPADRSRPSLHPAVRVLVGCWPVESRSVTEPLIDLRALLVEREDFEGGMVSRLREGLAQGGPRSATSRKSPTSFRSGSRSPPDRSRRRLHLKLGIAYYFLGHIRTAVEHLSKAEGPLAAFFLGQAHMLSRPGQRTTPTTTATPPTTSTLRPRHSRRPRRPATRRSRCNSRGPACCASRGTRAKRRRS